MKKYFPSWLVLMASLTLIGLSAQQTINLGTVANDGTGDPARTAFGKCNSNFTEVYATNATQTADIATNASSIATTNTNLATTNTNLATTNTTVAGHTTAIAANNKRTFGVVFDGQGSAVAAGSKLYWTVPYACTITAVTMLADTSGSAVVDIWKDTYANYPPTIADTIVAAAPPTISAAAKSTSSTLTGWTTAVAAGDTFVWNVTSCSTITKLTVGVTVTLP